MKHTIKVEAETMTGNMSLPVTMKYIEYFFIT